jgi:hypothetical protein
LQLILLLSVLNKMLATLCNSTLSSDVWQFCDALRHAAPEGYDYTFEFGKKYHKIIMTDCGGQRSVHCFVDKKTGEVYKFASWKSPAKGVRYDLRLIEQREWLFENATWHGSYLDAR